jgi:hypothetical protein
LTDHVRRTFSSIFRCGVIDRELAVTTSRSGVDFSRKSRGRHSEARRRRRRDAMRRDATRGIPSKNLIPAAPDERERRRHLRSVILSSLPLPAPFYSFLTPLTARVPFGNVISARSKNPAGSRHVRHRYNSLDGTVRTLDIAASFRLIPPYAYAYVIWIHLSPGSERCRDPEGNASLG